MRRIQTVKMVRCALFAAVLAVFSQLVIPIGPVPVNMATLALYCAAGLLGGKEAAVAAGLWVLIGAVGLPVFAMLQGGFSALAGPTGGFIIGYVPMAFITGSLIENLRRKNKNKLAVLAMAAGLLACFTLGTLWYMYSTHTGLWQSLVVCVWPFLPGEGAKMAVSLLVIKRFEPFIKKK